MDKRQHWDAVYGGKSPDQVSWFRPHLETSIRLIEAAAHANRAAAVLDAGGGASTLVDDLIARGYTSLTVVDISQAALDHARNRLGKLGDSVRWLCADITQSSLPAHSLDVWHDRAVFHFLTAPQDRLAYAEYVARTVKPGGHVIVGTFGPEGPTKCSGLDAARYDAQSLQKELGPRFAMIENMQELHQTPFGTTQQFLYCRFTLDE